MIDAEKNKFLEMMNGMAAVFATELTTPLVKIYWDVLKEYSLSEITTACNIYIRKGKFFPKPAEIIDLVPASKAHAHIGADEAWAIVLESMDEFKTVVMTKEILEARAIAWPLWEEGDRVGARMAFKDAYARIIATAGRPAWSVSLGYDAAGREPAVRKAVELGRLSRDEASKYLPAQMDGGPIGKLLTGKVVEFPKGSTELKKRWAGIKQSLDDAQERVKAREAEQAEERERDRLAFERKREEALRAVQDMLQQKTGNKKNYELG